MQEMGHDWPVSAGIESPRSRHDWVAWHSQYNDPNSGLAGRLRVIEDESPGHWMICRRARFASSACAQAKAAT